MHEITLDVVAPLSTPDIVSAWAVLWKDYISASNISFLLSDSARQDGQCESVELTLDEKETLGGLRRQVQSRLEQKHINGAQSSFSPQTQTHLYILRDNGNDDKNQSGHSTGRRKQLKRGVDQRESWVFKNVRVDLKIRVTIGEMQTRLKIIAHNASGVSVAQTSRILQQLAHVVAQISTLPQSWLIYGIETASARDVHDIWAWNRQCPEAQDTSIINVFKTHVAKNPEAHAVDAWDGCFTYRELDKLSTLLSLRLMSDGVRCGAIVPCCFEKTRWLLVAILATFKAGAAFVLLDEALPQSRLQQLVDIVSGSTVVVTLASAAQQHRALTLAPACIVVDSRLLDVKEGQKIASSSISQPSDLAYIVFTSGSTGVPKATMTRHANVCAFSAAVTPLNDITSASRVLLLASLAFDVSLGNIFTALLTGACLCLPSSWECRNSLAGIVDDYEATYVQTTPSLSKMIDPALSRNLNVLELSGEPCSEDAVARWRETHTRVMNTLGPAECTVTSVVNEDVLSSMKTSIIGRGLNVCWILDPVDQTRLTPIGGIGELVIEGPIVGAGYLNDADVTNKKFSDDPDWLSSGCKDICSGRRGRLYRSADLVRYTGAGEIEYIGRRDLQVKIRGQRVEMGEISACIQKLVPQDVQWCPEVVNIGGSEILLVFLVAASEHRLQTLIEEIDRETTLNLPPAMVPGAYARIDCIPLMLTGKTDHRRLKEMAQAMSREALLYPQDLSVQCGNGTEATTISPVTDQEYVSQTTTSSSASSTPGVAMESPLLPLMTTERIKEQMGNEHRFVGEEDEEAFVEKVSQMKHAWAQLFALSLSSIKETDTFFSYGGESLAAIRLVGLAARRGLQLDVGVIFRWPALSEMAMRCRLISDPAKFLVPDRFALLPSGASLSEMAFSCNVPVDRIEDAYPCTPMQEGLISAATTTSSRISAASYIGQGVLKLSTGIDPDRLARAWECVVTTHQMLRTRIVDTESSGFVQILLEDNPLTQQSRPLNDFLRQDTKGMCKGTQLCRATILRDASQSYFVLTMHHALYDGWTLPRIGLELFRAYRGARLTRGITFSTYVDLMKNMPREPAESFWANYLAGAAERTYFFPSVGQQHQQQLCADCELSKTLDLSFESIPGLSIPSILRAAWALLVSKLGDSRDVTFGTIISGRNVPLIGVEDLLGPTIASVPVRVKFNSEENVMEYLSRVQNEYLESISYETLGLQHIKSLNSNSRTACAFQTLFIVHPPGPVISENLDGIHPSERELGEGLGALDISHPLSNFNEYALMVLISPPQDKGRRIKVNTSFDSRVLSKERMELLLDQFENVIRQISLQANAARSLDILCLASGSDLDQIWSWNSATFASRRKCIHDIIAETTASYPSREAIRAHDGSITYAELDGYAARLAFLLCENGIGRESVVPICMPKSKWMAVAMFGILRSGAAFVTMDIRTQPEQRLRCIVRETKAKCIVTACGASAKALAHGLCDRVISCDEQLRETSSAWPSSSSSSPSDAAFIVFTSGSTGIPKGIIITHSNFSTLAAPHAQLLCLSQFSRVFDYASSSFDIAVHNALMALIIGGTLCVPSEHDRENDIEGSITRLNANWADLTPSVARLVDPSLVPGLKTLVLSGEAPDRALLEAWSNRKIVNAYGPAECQVCTIQQNLQSQDDAASIGKGVACSTWIVDPSTLDLLPIGAIGELLIEGPGVTPGYLNVSSKGVLVQDPSWLLAGSQKSKLPGRRGTVYRTGDLASYRPDGSLVYKGRASTQAKIHGQRVELGEIECHIRRHLAREERGVVAEIVSIQGLSRVTVFLCEQATEGGDLRMKLIDAPLGLEDSLRIVLPSYMMPSLFFNIAYAPLTPSGKIDRRTLREAAAGFSLENLVMDDKNATEHSSLTSKQLRMVRTWAEVLKIDIPRLNLSSDFFQAGGSSISAMLLVKTARKHGLSFTVAEVLRNSQLRQLCSVAVECTGEKGASHQARAESVPPFGLVPRALDLTALIASAGRACSVSREDVVDVYPCTPFQEGVFAQTAANSSAYVQHTMLRLSNKLQLSRVLAAWESVTQSNPILRTRVFQSEQGSLWQVVVRETLQWPRHQSIEHYMADTTESPMLLGGSLSRLAVLESEDTIVWSIHHALYDAWTIGLVLREVSAYYNGIENVDVYPNFNLYVRLLLRKKEEAREWWRSSLVGASDAAVFPKAPMTERESLVITTSRAIPLPQALPPGYTMPVLLRSAWSILMSRYLSGDHILFGEVRLGRNVPIGNVELMRGPTIASAPLLVRISQGQSLGSLLDSIREVDIEMQLHDHYGLQNIARLGEDARAACSFQTLLVFRENEEETVKADSIFEYDDVIDDIRNFHSWNFMLTFDNDKDKGLMSEAVFQESVIPKERVELLLQQIQHIFHTLCKMPLDSPLTEFNNPSELDLEQIWSWNAVTPETTPEFLHELVAKQSRKTPSKIAIDAHDGSLTYAELDSFSTNVASQLLSKGIGQGSFVPLVLEKSVWVPVAMLGVIKTGAAFTIMDVNYPESRLETIVGLLKARLALSSPLQSKLAARLCSDIFIISRASCTDIQPAISSLSCSSDNIMYVCFTSGSTGIPKGVMVSHKNLASAGVAQTRDLCFTSEDRVYDFSSHAFDATIWHTWWALIIGATVCIPSHDDRMGNLAGSIADFRTTALFLTPSVARTLDAAEVPTVQRLYLGGEAVTPLDVSQWKCRLDLWCAYGPTETTPLCIFTRLASPEFASIIGHGIGIKPWVCDPQNYNNLVAIGSVGEMLIEGPLVTLGYYKQPEATARAFVSDPEFLLKGTTSRPGHRGQLYRSGDLVRYCYNGSIEYLGRVDTQIKLRGQRVEFGEVEYYLKRALPGFVSVCEIITHFTTGRPMLAAFCASLYSDSELDRAEAQKLLNKELPPYMIPEAYFKIECIPRSPSGKIDRQRLRKIGPELLQSQNKTSKKIQAQRRPLTDKEAVMQRLWATALGEDIEPDSNGDFFDLGADSIAAMKLSNLARKEDWSLSIAEIMRNPKLAAMAEIMGSHIKAGSDPAPFALLDVTDLSHAKQQAASACDVAVSSISDMYPCTPLQVELFGLTMRQPQAYVRRCVFEVPVGLDANKLVESWNTVIALNPVLRTRFVDVKDQGLVQVVTAFNQVQEKESFQNEPFIFDFGSPLSRVTAFIGDRKILWTIHHALYDDSSVQLIEEQLRKVYANQSIVTPPAFSRFVRYITIADENKAKDFWRQRLAGCASLDSRYPALPSRTYRARPSQTWSRTLKALPQKYLQSTIHAAWAIIASRLSESDEVVFSATLSGRNAPVPGVGQMVGPTIAPVPIRVCINRDQSIQNLLRQVDQDVTETTPYQHVGMRAIKRINADTRAACAPRTLLVVTPANSEDEDGSKRIRAASFEIEGEDVFHTFGLVLFFTPRYEDATIELEVVFDSAIIEQREVERLAGRLESVISVLSGDGSMSVADVECVGIEDLEDIRGWNSTLPSGSEKLLHHIILDSAELQSDRVAIDASDVRISYLQLQAYSHTLGAKLRQMGIGPGAIVPILSQKSGYAPIAALATLRAGASFLPLDSMQPLTRLKAVTDQVRPAVILASQTCMETAMSLCTRTLPIESCLDQSWDTSTSSSSSSAVASDVACILFTSGTTGVPKGVTHTHAALGSAIQHQAQACGFNALTRSYDFASYGFDVSWNVIFKTLATGGTLCVPSEHERYNDLVGSINRARATLTELTASVARLINPSSLTTLETLIMSGEFVDMREFQHWTPKVRLVICYGPSECTSVATINDGGVADGIGKARACLTWLVDPNDPKKLVPIGAVGEILIDGPIVGTGYFGKNQLTSDKYMSDIPWLDANNRHRTTFRSGDLARYDGRGNLHFISRKDMQVKLHGQRIELEEVQHHVRAAIGRELITSVACCIIESEGKKYLAAFLADKIPRKKSDPCTLMMPSHAIAGALETLDVKLQHCLPRYMTPAAYYFITDIPRTINGKIDQRRLVELATGASPDLVLRGRSESSHSLRKASLTTVETKLQQFWSTVLGISQDSIGPDSHFFNLGGDSISAMKLVASARNDGYKLSVVNIFSNPVLCDLALTIDRTPTTKSYSERAFGLLGDAVDEISMRIEVTKTCSIADPSMIEDILPCTPLQESMIAATIKDPSAFTSLRLYRLSADIDLRRLQGAWAMIVARNRILRTRLVHIEGHGIRQVVVAGGESLLEPYSSLESFSEAMRGQIMGIGSRLTRWALIDRVHEHWLVWTIHHTMYDGWSLRLIEDEVNRAYLSQTLPSPRADMRSIIRYLQDKGGEEASREFWKKELSRTDGITHFPMMPQQKYEPKPETFLEKNISTDLRSLPAGINLASLIYGTWSLEVASITTQNKIYFGTIRTGRNAPVEGIDQLVGPTITTVPVIVNVDRSISMSEYFKQIQDAGVSTMPHEHFGISQIRKASVSAAAACDFQTVLVIQPAILTANKSDSIMEEIDVATVNEFPDQHAVLNQYGLMIEILPNGDKTTIRASFDSVLISTAKMDRIIGRWEYVLNRVLQSGASDLLMPLDSLSALSPLDLHDIWTRNTNLPDVVEEKVHENISKVSLQQPTALAIDACDGKLTYQQLDTLSSLLCARLISEFHVGPGIFVPMIFHKSKWANVSMLAVLKTGAAFVPLDANHPEGRLRAVMQPLNADFMLCSIETRDRASRLARHAFIVDEASLDKVGNNAVQSYSDIRGSDLAYAVFTSGSTGAPKGVKITHSNLATAIKHQVGANALQVGFGTRSLDSSSYSFDACIFNFFYTVTNGGCLCIPSDDSLKGNLGAFMRTQRVNWAQLVPSVARTLDPNTLPDLKHLFLTGEGLARGDIVTWSGNVHLQNLYGPTECTILCAVSESLTSPAQANHIGQGHGANLWLTEVDDPSKLVSVGAVGEILIEGPLIGAGYLGPYEWPLVVDPPWLLAGANGFEGRRGMMFRTGDQAYYNDDGSLTLLGRIGADVKLRGQRVDLLEIEDIARACKPCDLEIVACIVSVDWKEGGHERQMLLLFVASSDEEDADEVKRWIPDLKCALDEAIPLNLQPEALALLPSIPKTSSGKADRRHLKNIGAKLRPKQVIWILSSNISVTPSTPISTPEQQHVASLWAEVLDIKTSSIVQEDDFFQLGGTSLGVMRLMTKAHERGLILRARDIFEHPKLAQLALRIVKLRGVVETAPYKPFDLISGGLGAFIEDHVISTLNVSAEDVEDILPANGFQVDYMHNEEEPLGLQYAYINIGPNVSWPRLLEAFRMVIQSFQCFRSRFIYHKGLYYQIVLRTVPLEYQELITDEQMTSFCNTFCALDCRAASISDVLTKLTLVHAGQGRRRVILRTSHMHYDGWCINRVLHFIAQAYNSGALPREEPSWTSLLHVRQQQTEPSHSYWKALLQGTTQATLPLTHRPGDGTNRNVRTLRTYALSNFHSSVDNRRTRPTVVVNVAWALVLQKLLGENDLVFGNVTTGRNGDMPGLDSVIGPCVNMLPLRLRVGAASSTAVDRKQMLRALVEASAEQVDGRAPFEGLDWDETVRECTHWPEGTRYASAVHFRNMEFEPELFFDEERVVVGWYELVATPHWTTVLVYPEENVLRLWLLADPTQIGNEGADEILKLIAGYVDEIRTAIAD